MSQVNVFKLGRTFKALHRAITIAKDGIMPVLPEDLIWRFASLLDFDTFTNKVADDAIRMAQRMSLDWMLMGRRPSGVCGACLILAARMNNFRRTVTEVVYVVKVTTATIQKRLEEFKLTPTSALTVDEFVNNEFLESSHDPPSFYQKTEEFQKSKKCRKRKRALPEHEEQDREIEDEYQEIGEGHNHPDTYNKNSISQDEQDQLLATALVSAPNLQLDTEGFPIAPLTSRSGDIPIDPQLLSEVIADQSRSSFEQLVKEFGDVGTLPEEEVDEEEEEDEDEDQDGDDTTRNTNGTPVQTRKRGRPSTKNQAVHVPSEWAATEISMEEEITEMINDPNTITHATQYARARQLAAAHVLLAEKINPQKEVCMDVHVGEDEFADDPEVQNCLLSPADVAMKEKVWINANKDWLRKQQLKEWNKKQAANDPPKAKRNRKKKPRIGEGQTSAANSPAEAAISVLKQRSFSKKINYDAINGLFADIDKMAQKKSTESSSSSKRSSRAASEMEGSENSAPHGSSKDHSANDVMEQSSNKLCLTDGLLLPQRITSKSTGSTSAARNQKRAEKLARATEADANAISPKQENEKEDEEEEEEGNDDDYINPNSIAINSIRQEPLEEAEYDDWKEQINTVNRLDNADSDNEKFDEWEPDPDPFIDDDFGARGFESEDNDEEYE